MPQTAPPGEISPPATPPSCARRNRLPWLLLWFGPLVFWAVVIVWSGTEATRYETTWRFLQWCLRILCPEHAPPEAATGVQVQITMYQLNGAFRRLAHIVVYAMLAALTVRAIQKGEPRLKPVSLVAALVLGIAYTIIDEANRGFFQANRHAKWADLILNLIGIGLTVGGTIVYFAFKNWEQRMVEAEGVTRNRVDSLEELLERVNTLPLEREGTVTRALVVLNPANEAVTGRARYRASFPIRREVGPRPVTVFDEKGNVVPSRLLSTEAVEDPALPADRVRWNLELEFTVTIPARSGRAYGSQFGESGESRSSDEAYWDGLTLLPVSVHETECHAGTWPLTFPLPAHVDSLVSGEQAGNGILGGNEAGREDGAE